MSVLMTIGATPESGTGTRFSELNRASTAPLAPSNVEYWGSWGMTSGGRFVAIASKFAAPTMIVELTTGTKRLTNTNANRVDTRTSNAMTRGGIVKRQRSVGGTATPNRQNKFLAPARRCG